MLYSEEKAGKIYFKKRGNCSEERKKTKMKDENKIQTKKKQPSMFIDTRKKEKKRSKRIK